MKGVLIVFVFIIVFAASLVFLQQLYYAVIVRAYHIAIRVAALFNKKAKLWVQGRRNLFTDLERNFHFPGQKKIWIHCASLGEFEQGRTLIEQIKKESPEVRILLTFYSPSGYTVRKDYAFADYVCYFPADTPSNAKRFLAIVQPDVALFVKYEFWYFHLAALKQNKVPLFLIAGIFRKKQLFFRWYGRLHRQMLRMYTRIFVQNQESLDLLKKIKITTAEIIFDTRFDRVKAIADTLEPPQYIETFVQDHNVIIAGSTWPEDEKLLQSAFYHSMVYENFKIIIAPHNIDQKSLAKTKKRFKKYALLYSELSKVQEADIRGKRVLILDNMGMLASIYKYADVNYIGGGFGKGVHNTLEAAVYGKPLFFGPNYKKFNEAVELVNINAAQVVEDRDELLNRVNLMNQFQFIWTAAGRDAREYVNSHTGGTTAIINRLRIYLN